ncbi:hypothetical protein AGMMS49579_15270 [Spirochaetia bacterium]|nr:hypothetical protein AGMMS49579_15270 [Spirochaetia bacterium]
MEIKVNSFMDKPFGMLKNDFKYKIPIENKLWSSINNYVYSNLLPVDTVLRQTLEHEQPYKVYNSYANIRQDLENDILSSTIKTGLAEKIKLDPRFRDILMKTDGTILYLSKNKYLGYSGKKSTNVYGVWLQQYRTELLRNYYKQKSNSNDKDSIIYDYYLAEKGLQYALQYENLDRYLHEFNLQNIVSELANKYGNDKIFIVDKETALTIQRNRTIEPYSNPSNLVKYIQKTYIRKVRESNIDKLKYEVFKRFVFGIMDEDYPHDPIDKDKILNDQLNTISLNKKINLIDRTFYLYQMKKLPFMDVNFQLYIPSIEEVNKYESMVVPIPIVNNRENVSTIDRVDFGFSFVYPNRNDATIKIGGKVIDHNVDHDMLSPANDSIVLLIDGYKYPSISHYMIVKLTQTIPHYEHISKAYGAIINENDNLFLPLDKAEVKFKNIKYNNLQIKKIDLLKEALNAKFSLGLFRNILVSTNPSPISFNDNNELNDVSITEIIKIRDKLLSTIRNDHNRGYLDYWIEEKLKETCFVIKCVQLLKRHYNLTVNLTETFIRKVVNTFYSYVITQNKYEDDYPEFAGNAIKEYFSIGSTVSSTSITHDSASYLYNYFNDLLNIFFNVLLQKNKEIPPTFYFVANVVNATWLLNTYKKDNLYETTLKNKTIVSALIDVILKLKNIVSKDNVTVMDVKIAASILLGYVVDIEDNNITSKDILIERAVGEKQVILESDVEEDEFLFNDDTSVINEEEELEEQEGIDYNDENYNENEFVDAYYEGQPRDIIDYFPGLTLDAQVERTIIKYSTIISKSKNKNNMIHLRTQFYG